MPRDLGFTGQRALLCARSFSETTRDRVNTRGVSRFPRFVRTIHAGRIDIHGTPECVRGHGGLERWDGKCGVGNLNAWYSMDRAMALANTTHWTRGGTYPWQAAEARFAGICWTNTMPNLPQWRSTEARPGNR